MRKKLACIFAACLLTFCASLPAFADEVGTGFTPSVTNKAAPEVDMDKTTVIINGAEVDLENNASLKLVVTPIAKPEDAPNQKVATDLKAAIDELSKNGKDLKFAKPNDEKSFKEFKEKAEKDGKTLVCTDMFDLSVTDKDGNTVQIDKGTFTVEVEDAENIVLVLHRADGSWEKVDFIINSDGTITFTLDGLSPIAFFSQADAAKVVDVVSKPSSNVSKKPTTVVVKPDTDAGKTEGTAATTSSTSNNGTSSVSSTKTSPQTGVGNSSMLLVSALITTIAGVTLVVKAKKE